MSDTIDIDMAEVLAARLCHELISPVGAIANGAEILEDEPEFAEDAARLIADSTRIVVHRLQFYREAYGSRGGAESRARSVTVDFFKDSKIICDWPETAATGSTGLGKLACNMMLLASEMLPRGGQLNLSGATGELRILGSGDGARVGDTAGLLARRLVTADLITPRTVQALFTKALAEKQGLRLEAQDMPGDRVSLAALLAP